MWTAERWTAYYSEGRIFRSEETTWQELPELGVLVIALDNPTGRTVLAGGDWYFLDGGRYGYVASREWGKPEPRPALACRSCVKEGVGVSNDEMNETYSRAWKRAD